MVDARLDQYNQAMEIDKISGKPMPKVATSLSGGAAYNQSEDMLKVQSLQKKWKDSFIGNGLNTNLWDVITNTGGTIAASGGELQLNLGMVQNNEIIIQTKEIFTDPFRALLGVMFTGTPTGQEWSVEAVSVDANGEPDNLHGCGWVWKLRDDHATLNYYARYYTKNGGLAPLVSAAVSVGSGTPWSAYHIWELELFADEVWFHARVLDSVNGRSYSAVRHQQLPDPNARFKIRLRGKNINTPSVANTLKAQFLTVVDYAELTAEITAGRGNTAPGQGISAQISGGTLPTVTTLGTLTTMTTGFVAGKNAAATVTTSAITTATPFTSAAIDGGTTLSYTKYRARFIFDQPVKVEFICGTSATVASNKVQQTDDIPANTPTVIEYPLVARYCAVRITNTGTGVTTVHECLGMLLGL